MAKQLHFNKNMEALKKLQAGVDKLSSVVGVTLGPKARLHSHHRLACRQWHTPQTVQLSLLEPWTAEACLPATRISAACHSRNPE